MAHAHVFSKTFGQGPFAFLSSSLRLHVDVLPASGKPHRRDRRHKKDGARFTNGNFAFFDAVLFLDTSAGGTEEVLNAERKVAFQNSL